MYFLYERHTGLGIASPLFCLTAHATVSSISQSTQKVKRGKMKYRILRILGIILLAFVIGYMIFVYSKVL